MRTTTHTSIVVDLERNQLAIVKVIKRPIFDQDNIFPLEGDVMGRSYIEKRGEKYYYINELYGHGVIERKEITPSEAKIIIKETIQKQVMRE